MPKYIRKSPSKKELVGVDLFVHWNGTEPNELGEILESLNSPYLHLKMITNRGIKVWPNGFKETFCTDHWRCRYMPHDGFTATNHHIIELLEKAEGKMIDAIKTENLYFFDGKAAFALGHGQ